MAIQVNGTTVINDSRALNNIASIDSGSAAVLSSAGVGGSSSPSAYAVGSYITGRPNNFTRYATGDTATSLQSIPFSSSNSMQYLNTSGWQSLGAGVTVATPSGTWRCMSTTWGSPAPYNYGYKGLWMRIS